MLLSISLVCADKYQKSSGAVGGQGTIASHKDVGTTFECAKFCDAVANCCSYEWSPIAKTCQINVECNPSTMQTQERIAFCLKGKYSK